MRWYRQLRWKLFVSHLAMVVIADLVLIVTAFALLNFGLIRDAPLSLSTTAAETGELPVGADSDLSPAGLFRNVFQQALLISGFATFVTAVLASLFVARRIVDPVQAISTTSRRLAQGFYRERTTINSDDELADLSGSVNQLAAALEQSEQRRMTLLADVTHELRTPLATIEGYVEGMLDGVVPANQQNLSLIHREAARLQRLIEDLELLSRVEAGSISVKSQHLDLVAVLKSLLYQFQPQFEMDGSRLELCLPADLPAVWADPDRLNQVLVNLLANAYRYTPAGGWVRIEVHCDDEMVCIAVIDNGIGIDPAHLPHLFERFYRVDKSRARKSGGSGIGLTISRHLVFAMGGEIWAESAGIGHGATFHVTLPLAPALEAEASIGAEVAL
jgi:signal transduction histidine kinase